MKDSAIPINLRVDMFSLKMNIPTNETNTSLKRSQSTLSTVSDVYFIEL